MKLLLTSGGIVNSILAKTLLEMAARPANEIKVAFIPTAMNTEPGDKGWAIAQMTRLQTLGVGQLDIVEISAVPKGIWLPRLEESNLIFVNGGNTTHLMTCFNEAGLTEILPELLQTRVYVGVSAGSYIATPDLRFNSDKTEVVLDGLRLVDFGLQAHYKSPRFPQAKSLEAIQERTKDCPYPVYVLDDQMAVKVADEVVEVVGEGEFALLKMTI
jgi:dipeptidase E